MGFGCFDYFPATEASALATTPRAGLSARVGDGVSGSCSVDGDPLTGHSFACEVPPFGADEQTVLLSIAGEDRFVPTGLLWQPPPPVVMLAAISDNLTRVNVEIVDLAGRTVLDVELRVNGELQWIEAFAASDERIVRGLGDGDLVCVNVRGFAESGNCLTATAGAGSFDATSDDPTTNVPSGSGGFPVVIFLIVGLVVLIAGGIGVRV